MEVLILLFLIGMEATDKCADVVLMVKAHLLNIKSDSVKALK